MNCCSHLFEIGDVTPRTPNGCEYVTLRTEVQMNEEELEVLVTMDDPGEDTLEEDTFHLQADNLTARRSGQPQLGGDPTSKQK